MMNKTSRPLTQQSAVNTIITRPFNKISRNGQKSHFYFPKSATGPQLLTGYVIAQLAMQNVKHVNLFSLDIFL